MTSLERKTRKLFAIKVKNKRAAIIIYKLRDLIDLNKLKVKSITTNKGDEFEYVVLVDKQKCFDCYYCKNYAFYKKVITNTPTSYLEENIRRVYISTK